MLESPRTVIDAVASTYGTSSSSSSSNQPWPSSSPTGVFKSRTNMSSLSSFVATDHYGANGINSQLNNHCNSQYSSINNDINTNDAPLLGAGSCTDSPAVARARRLLSNMKEQREFYLPFSSYTMTSPITDNNICHQTKLLLERTTNMNCPTPITTISSKEPTTGVVSNLQVVEDDGKEQSEKQQQRKNTVLNNIKYYESINQERRKKVEVLASRRQFERNEEEVVVIPASEFASPTTTATTSKCHSDSSIASTGTGSVTLHITEPMTPISPLSIPPEYVITTTQHDDFVVDVDNNKNEYYEEPILTGTITNNRSSTCNEELLVPILSPATSSSNGSEKENVLMLTNRNDNRMKRSFNPPSPIRRKSKRKTKGTSFDDDEHNKKKDDNKRKQVLNHSNEQLPILHSISTTATRNESSRNHNNLGTRRNSRYGGGSNSSSGQNSRNTPTRRPPRPLTKKSHLQTKEEHRRDSVFRFVVVGNNAMNGNVESELHGSCNEARKKVNKTCSDSSTLPSIRSVGEGCCTCTVEYHPTSSVETTTRPPNDENTQIEQNEQNDVPRFEQRLLITNLSQLENPGTHHDMIGTVQNEKLCIIDTIEHSAPKLIDPDVSFIDIRKTIKTQNTNTIFDAKKGSKNSGEACEYSTTSATAESTKYSCSNSSSGTFHDRDIRDENGQRNEVVKDVAKVLSHETVTIEKDQVIACNNRFRVEIKHNCYDVAVDEVINENVGTIADTNHQLLKDEIPTEKNVDLIDNKDNHDNGDEKSTTSSSSPSDSSSSTSSSSTDDEEEEHSVDYTSSSDTSGWISSASKNTTMTLDYDDSDRMMTMMTVDSNSRHSKVQGNIKNVSNDRRLSSSNNNNTGGVVVDVSKRNSKEDDDVSPKEQVHSSITPREIIEEDVVYDKKTIARESLSSIVETFNNVERSGNSEKDHDDTAIAIVDDVTNISPSKKQVCFAPENTLFQIIVPFPCDDEAKCVNGNTGTGNHQSSLHETTKETTVAKQKIETILSALPTTTKRNVIIPSLFVPESISDQRCSAGGGMYTLAKLNEMFQGTTSTTTARATTTTTEEERNATTSHSIRKEHVGVKLSSDFRCGAYGSHLDIATRSGCEAVTVASSNSSSSSQQKVVDNNAITTKSAAASTITNETIVKSTIDDDSWFPTSGGGMYSIAINSGLLQPNDLLTTTSSPRQSYSISIVLSDMDKRQQKSSSNTLILSERLSDYLCGCAGGTVFLTQQTNKTKKENTNGEDQSKGLRR